jgi:hypothetical protein
MSDKASEIIALRDRERDKQQGYWWSLYQDAADLVYPREDQINTKNTPGEDKSVRRLDSTAVESSKRMASGLATSLNVTTGSRFFGIKAVNPALARNDAVRRWCWTATGIVLDALYGSNIIMHMVQSFRSLVTFGTNCLFSEWDAQHGQLNFKDHAISTYTIKENNHGDVDTVILSFKMTARQAVAEYGEENLGKEIIAAAADLEKESKKFDFIWIVRPRTELNILLSDDMNMPFESVVVEVKGRKTVYETGYMELPFHVARWEKGATEKYGRGPGTDYIADIRQLQKLVADFMDICNKKSLPPLEVLSSFEGRVNLNPKAINRVQQMDSIRPINQGATGELQAVWQAITEMRQRIKDYFYESVFTPIGSLQDKSHRTAAEIEQRRQEGLRLLAAPVMNVQSELLTPLIMRCFMLLLRNGRIPMPPQQLMKVTGRSKTAIQMDIDPEQLGLEYIGPMALALSNQEAQGSQALVAKVMQIDSANPEIHASDYVNWGSAIPRWAQADGVNVEDLASDDQVQAKQQARAKQQQAMMAMQAAQAAGNANKGLSKKPEAGSPAEALMGAQA